MYCVLIDHSSSYAISGCKYNEKIYNYWDVCLFFSLMGDNYKQKVEIFWKSGIMIGYYTDF